MLEKIKSLINLNRSLYFGGLQEATGGTIKISDNVVVLDINGSFKTLTMKYSGKVFVYNKLSNGHSIRVSNNIIRIVNFLGRNLFNDKVIFEFDGTFDIYKAEIKTFNNNRFLLDIENTSKTLAVNQSKTNVEDDSLLILDEENQPSTSITKSRVDDDTIKGLYTNKQFKNGYLGYYNYSPSQKIFTTGKSRTASSIPIGNKQQFSKIQAKPIDKIKREIQSPINKIKAPEKNMKLIKRKERIKRGKY